ncbi:hypothetical protein SLS58_001659 [Diplodia intermedia]|uniref:Uncharacterized protein n=1 Tax=Diplodia intermedia TaxID=856260 RepID=A0ABR3U1S5_9PEZI
MFSKAIVQALAISAVATGVAAQACPESGPGASPDSLFKSCGQVQGSMNVCTTGAVTACSCSVLQNEME